VSDFLNAVKADLLDRRLLPVLAVVGVALAAAVGYAVLAGGGSSAGTPTAAISSSPLTGGAAVIAVTPVQPSAGAAVAETTSGSAQQRGGPSRNPFAPLPAPASGSASQSSPSSTSGSGSGSAGSPASSRAATPASTSPGPEGAGKPPSSTSQGSGTQKPAKPPAIYQVTAAFGVAPPGPLPPDVKLAQYANLKRQQPLPSAKQPLVVFRGVNAGGKSATFTLVGEAILRGSAACVPSPSQCQAISLKPGQTEELEFLTPGGAAVSYQLQVMSISSVKASTASVRRSLSGESKAGGQFLRRSGLVVLPGLRYSPEQGVLVVVGVPARPSGAQPPAGSPPAKH
jgi:hypothetical protein